MVRKREGPRPGIKVVRFVFLLLFIASALGGCYGGCDWFNKPPVAKFSTTSTSGEAPLEVTFDAFGSYDPDGDEISYEWDFGDGNIAEGGTVQHGFGSPGSYTVRLLVTDSKGKFDKSSKFISVSQPPDETTEEQFFELQTGIEHDTSTGLKVSVPPKATGRKAKLVVTENPTPQQPEGGFIELQSIYNISLSQESSSQEQDIASKSTFQDPPLVTLTFEIPPGVDARSAMIMEWTSEGWVPVSSGQQVEDIDKLGGVISPDARSISVDLQHLSTYALAIVNLTHGYPSVVLHYSPPVITDTGDINYDIVLESPSVLGIKAGAWYQVVVRGSNLKAITSLTDALCSSMNCDMCYLTPKEDKSLRLVAWGNGTTASIVLDPFAGLNMFLIDFAYRLVTGSGMAWPYSSLRSLEQDVKKIGEAVTWTAIWAGTKLLGDCLITDFAITSWVRKVWPWLKTLNSAISYAKYLSSCWLLSCTYANLLAQRKSGVIEYTILCTSAPHEVVIEPATPEIDQGTSIQFTASLIASNRSCILSTKVSWHWEVSGGGTINEGGLFTAYSGTSGTYTVKATTPAYNLQGKLEQVVGETTVSIKEITNVTLTLYVHEGSSSGPKLSGARVAGHDGAGNHFDKTTNSSGYVRITGSLGTWHFAASKSGYQTNTWDQSITSTTTKHAYLVKEAVPDVTLTLYVHENSTSGPTLAGVQVQGYDGDGSSFNQTTNSSGYVRITGAPGTWHFSASKSGYQTNTWDQSITSTSTKHAYLVKEAVPDVTLTLYVHEGSSSGPKLSGARVAGHDGAGNHFDKTTNSSGYVRITGSPGTWHFAASKSGYESNIWDQSITTTCTKHAYLTKQAPADVTLTLYVHEGSTSGPALSGVQVQGYDGSGSSFNQTTNSSGYVTITGQPGSWHFAASKSGYNDKSWSQSITSTSTKHAYITKQLTAVTLTLYVHEGSTGNPGLPGVRVQGADSAGNPFDETTNASGYVELTGIPGTWTFNISKDDYESQSWSWSIPETITRHCSMFRDPSSTVTLTMYVHEGSTGNPGLPGVRVQGADSAGNPFDETTNASGYVELTGIPGTWTFNISKDDYESQSWSWSIPETITRHCSMFRDPSSTITITVYVYESTWGSPPLADVRVEGHDGAGDTFDHFTDSQGYSYVTGTPGTWEIEVSKQGYIGFSWSEPYTSSRVQQASMDRSTGYPVACFTYSPEIPTTETPVSFTDCSTHGQTRFSDEPGYNTSWFWDFGDGTTANAQNPIHQFSTSGTYTVCLVATNNYGAIDKAFQALTIAPASP